MILTTFFKNKVCAMLGKFDAHKRLQCHCLISL